MPLLKLLDQLFAWQVHLSLHKREWVQLHGRPLGLAIGTLDFYFPSLLVFGVGLRLLSSFDGLADVLDVFVRHLADLIV